MSTPRRVSEDTAREILSGLRELYPDADVELRWETPIELPLILHGRRVCVAKKPRCSECRLAEWCPRHGVGQSA